MKINSFLDNLIGAGSDDRDIDTYNLVYGYKGPVFKAVYCTNVQKWAEIIKVAAENSVEIDDVLTFNQCPILYIIDDRHDASKLLRSMGFRKSLQDGLRFISYADFCKALAE